MLTTTCVTGAEHVDRFLLFLSLRSFLPHLLRGKASLRVCSTQQCVPKAGASELSYVAENIGAGVAEASGALPSIIWS